jgi:ATP-dependent protease ClpP protease subunit
MIHQGYGGFRGSPPDALIQMREWEHLVKMLHEILARHSGQPTEKVEKDTERDFFMSPEDAKAYGIIDAVYYPQGAAAAALADVAAIEPGKPDDGKPGGGKPGDGKPGDDAGGKS